MVVLLFTETSSCNNWTEMCVHSTDTKIFNKYHFPALRRVQELYILFTLKLHRLPQRPLREFPLTSPWKISSKCKKTFTLNYKEHCEETQQCRGAAVSSQTSKADIKPLKWRAARCSSGPFFLLSEDRRALGGLECPAAVPKPSQTELTKNSPLKRKTEKILKVFLPSMRAQIRIIYSPKALLQPDQKAGILRQIVHPIGDRPAKESRDRQAWPR